MTKDSYFYKKIIILLAAMNGFVFFLRAHSIISFNMPNQIITTGCEEESIYAIWKFVHHKMIYSDEFLPPFAISSYNWLFYWIYGSLTKLVFFVNNMGDAW